MSEGRDARPARPPLTRAQRKALLELQDHIVSRLFDMYEKLTNKEAK